MVTPEMRVPGLFIDIKKVRLWFGFGFAPMGMAIAFGFRGLGTVFADAASVLIVL